MAVAPAPRCSRAVIRTPRKGSRRGQPSSTWRAGKPSATWRTSPSGAKGSASARSDFNFWGLTFERDGNGFYATLDTRGVQYLVRGNIDRKEVHVVRADVECPSLSPDNTQLVFKRLIGARSRGWWQLARLDLATNTETVLARETRSVDDQVEWLDDSAVLYHLTGSRHGRGPVGAAGGREVVAAAFARKRVFSGRRSLEQVRPAASIADWGSRQSPRSGLSVHRRREDAHLSAGDLAHPARTDERHRHLILAARQPFEREFGN